MRLTPLIPRAFGAGLFCALALASRPSEASVASRIPSVLVIAKSSNKNEVHYAVQVDETCAPTGTRPVSPYWLMLERGPNVTEPLGSSEEHVLGVDREDIGADGVRMTLRGFPTRPLTIHTWQGTDGRCASSVEMTIAGVPSRVASVYVQQRLFGIAYVLLTGVSASGAVVTEKLKP